MSDKMQQFTTVRHAMPDKRTSAERRRDFNEIYQDFSVETATEQASRCEQCGIPYCQIHCPLQNNIPDWLRLATEGRLEEAYETSQATNTFPEICGRICPQDRLCEGSCVLEQSRHTTVTIGAIEKHITDTAWENGWVKPPQPVTEKTASVGIIGSGPAGLAAADQLRRLGYQTHVYERQDRIGGLLIYGIPNFKLDKDIVARRTELLQQGGVHFHLSFEVGVDASIEDLQKRHDAVLIATGVYQPRTITMPGCTLAGTHMAMDYLVASNKVGLGDDVADYHSGALNANGKKVVVVGGGDTAMDCVRTAIRQGAKTVKCLYRRNRANMPGSVREVANAEEEGVEFIWQAAPVALIGDDHVQQIRAHKIHLGIADASGRQTPKPVPDSHFTIDADMVIMALGFEPEDLPEKFDQPELATTDWSTLKIDAATYQTSLPGVFAAGDISRGASLVVWAIHDGREAAARIDDYITRTSLQMAEAS